MKHLATKPQAAALATTLILPALLVACGGGSDSTTPAPVTPTSLVINGTAATGAAMASAVVKLTCAKGTATVTASAAGVFSATITDGALPCVLTATSADGKTELHSLAAGTGNAATTVNVTPLSELLIARLSGGDAKAFVSGFGASTAISAADVTAAQTALLASLKAAGLDTGSVTDIVGGALTAGSSAGYDGVLDKLGVLLTSAGITLTDLSTAVSTTTKTGSDTSNATIGTLLAPAASDCPGFKSGALRVIDLTGGESTVMTVDATKLTVNDGTTTYPLTRNAACDYTVGNANAARVLVSRAGVAVFMSGSGKTGWVGVAFPEQRLDLSALAATYNTVSYSNVAAGGFGDTVFATDGRNGLSHNCTTLKDCVADTQAKGQLVPNAGGGFDYANDPRGSQARVFAYRTLSGKPMMIALRNDHTVTVMTKQEPLALPALNRVAAYWQFNANQYGVFPAVVDTNTVTSVDPAASTVTRLFSSDLHTDAVVYNTPFPGMRHRDGASCAPVKGGYVSCNSAVHLPFGGMQLSVSAEPSKVIFMTVVVDKP
ncbi:MAG: hypothetical protein J7598_05020 [Mitsuaria chitosanitabida]|uniref:hypothetical protein n=1 Tax=Roseateles chitosanitabidus TaxID=65048 RepID=UPI001B2A292A|nr:hypothetical protein [Roseateles chitosanitabidus]MBO9685953.1 hypothetical protein [Roseateles chitosanitabidus]